jgi:thiamine biosynthesis protein ThiI
MKLISLLSSGIDSPVATYLLSKKAKEIIVIHGDTEPFTDRKEYENFIKLLKHLRKIIDIQIKSYVLYHSISLEEYIKKCDRKYTCVFCKRMLLRYAEKISKINGFDAIIMGDSLGQVASQTLQNIKIIDQAVEIPILRPLIGFDKKDIVSISKKIGTYDISILPSSSCTAVPNNPSTAAKLKKIIEEEEKLDIKSLVEKAVKNSKKVNI